MLPLHLTKFSRSLSVLAGGETSGLRSSNEQTTAGVIARATAAHTRPHGTPATHSCTRAGTMGGP
eukprot:6190121-Pleurochrysis_carterae.AAC.2